MRILITGAAGQVGREIVRLAEAEHQPLALTRADLDITDAAAVAEAVRALRPDAVVNAAAYTAVDRAESEPERAFAINRDGARHVAAAAQARGIPVVHLSTDYVFDGAKGAPYEPSDPVAPLNVYGASKAEGEAAVLDACTAAVVLRTAWVFSRFPGNFVSTMWRLAAERDRLSVVADQWGHPTAAADVARAAMAACERARSGLGGILHAAGAPLANWHRLAEAAIAAAAPLRADLNVPVDPIPTSAYPTAARRPGRVGLDLSASFETLGLAPFDWRTSLNIEALRRFSTEGEDART